MKPKILKRIICLLLLVPFLAFAQKEDVWDFPVRPGTKEWKSLKNNAEKVEVCQVPNKVLTAMSAQELLQICMNYPLLPDIFAFSNITVGFDKFESDFNGFRELLKHDDAPKELLRKYKSIDPAAIPDNGTILEKGNYALSMSFIELFFSHPLMIEKLGTSDKKEIVKELLSKKGKKKDRPDWYQTTGMQTNYLAIVNIIQSDPDKFQSGLEKSKVSPYIYSGILTDSEVLNQIDQEANQYLKIN